MSTRSIYDGRRAVGLLETRGDGRWQAFDASGKRIGHLVEHGARRWSAYNVRGEPVGQFETAIRAMLALPRRR
jgi:hypothetical protein